MLKLEMLGHLGADAIVREANGKSVVNFDVAHTERFKDSAGVQKERTIWVSCSMWERENLAPYLKKGTQVFVEGFPTVESYTKSSGEPGASQKLRVGYLQFCGSKEKATSQDAAQPEGVSAPTEDIPF